MNEALRRLRRAVESRGADDVVVRGGADGGRATAGAGFRERPGVKVARRRVLVGSKPRRNLRDDVARALHEHDAVHSGAAERPSQSRLVVQARRLDGHAADLDGLHERDRRERAGAADCDLDANKARGLAGHVGVELVRDGAARRLARRAAREDGGSAVDLVHGPVHLKPQARCIRAGGKDRPLRDEVRVVFYELRRHGRQISVRRVHPEMHAQRRRRDSKAPAFEGLALLCVREVADRVADEVVRDELEGPPSSLLGVELAERAGGCVARRGELLVAAGSAGRVERQEFGNTEANLAADLNGVAWRAV
mmetsp:Transcript_9594/g.33713  ORF Transcript_9594/g.33713 Transcript_9594/m.33713 type:complete len:309 (-) Transcript_9594:604-1530(-)